MSAQRSLPAKILASLLCVLIGAVFIFSGISKIPTLEQFGWTVVENTPLNWTLAEWFTRILIGLELFLGVLFIFHIKIKKIALPVSFLLLIVFTVYLLLVIKSQGSSGNCGCFGEVMPMTPLQSVYKNIAMLIVTGIIYFLYHELHFRGVNIVTTILLLTSLLVPFLFNPPESIFLYEKDKNIQIPLPLSLLYTSPNNKPPKEELRKGKHVLLFMSLTCEYCRKAAKRVRIMKEKNPDIPFYAIMNGDSSKLKPFFEDTRMTNIPYSIFNGAAQFTLLNRGTSLPTIKWVKDTTLVREANYITLHENDILEWLREKE